MEEGRDCFFFVFLVGGFDVGRGLGFLEGRGVVIGGRGGRGRGA